MKKIPVIFDVDTGLDDTLALFVGVNAPQFNVLAVTATYGNTLLHNSVKNTLNAINLLGRSDVPVAAGAKRGWVMPQHTSPQIHGVTGIGDYVYPVDSYDGFQNIPAWDLIYDRVMGCEDNAVIFVLGPCTNIANAIRKYPRIKEKLDRIVFMGGGVRRGAAAQCASVNVYHDSEAFHFLMQCGVPFHMCGAEHMTGFVSVTMKQAEEKLRNHGTICDAALEMLRYYNKTTAMYDGAQNERVVLHDPAAVMYMLESECFFSKKVFCDVELKGRYSYGMTVIDLEDVWNKPDVEKNVHYIYTKPECAEYLSQKFFEYILNAV